MLTCGPLPILSPAMKRSGRPIQQGLGSQAAHLWATAYFVPRYEAWPWEQARLEPNADIAT